MRGVTAWPTSCGSCARAEVPLETPRISPPRLSHLLAASFIDTGVAPEMAIDPFGRA